MISRMIENLYIRIIIDDYIIVGVLILRARMKMKLLHILLSYIIEDNLKNINCIAENVYSMLIFAYLRHVYIHQL